MKRTVEMVRHGYEPPAPGGRRGTLVYYDDFERADDLSLHRALRVAENRQYALLVLYPLHEETVKRLSRQPVSPYYRRKERLEEWVEANGGSRVAIDGWEGKRKKYTPIEAALRQLTASFDPPFALYLEPDVANRFASFDTFETWIVQLRLVLSEAPDAVHPKLAAFRHRWDVAEEASEAD